MPRLKAIVGVVVVVWAFYMLWKILPPYVQEYEFQQEIQSIARNNEYSPLDEKGIRNEVRRKIADIGVPIDPEAVVIQKAGSDVTIGVNYTVHIDAVVHPFNLEFHPSTKNGDQADPVASNRTPLP